MHKERFAALGLAAALTMMSLDAHAAIVITSQRNYAFANSGSTVSKHPGTIFQVNQDYYDDAVPSVDYSAYAEAEASHPNGGTAFSYGAATLQVDTDAAGGTFAANGSTSTGGAVTCGLSCGIIYPYANSEVRWNFIVDTPYRYEISSDTVVGTAAQSWLFEGTTFTFLYFDFGDSVAGPTTGILQPGSYELYGSAFSFGYNPDGGVTGPLDASFSLRMSLTPVPLPAGVWLLLSALGLAGFLPWRRRPNSGGGSIGVRG